MSQYECEAVVGIHGVSLMASLRPARSHLGRVNYSTCESVRPPQTPADTTQVESERERDRRIVAVVERKKMRLLNLQILDLMVLNRVVYDI